MLSPAERKEFVADLSAVSSKADGLFNVLVHGGAPGAAELQAMCEAAEQVATWCRMLDTLPAAGAPEPPDGAWIEPPAGAE